MSVPSSMNSTTPEILNYSKTSHEMVQKVNLGEFTVFFFLSFFFLKTRFSLGETWLLD